ncbi:MAG: polysaccharide deacetylase family protein [Gemmatimonadota bacterium]
MRAVAYRQFVSGYSRARSLRAALYNRVARRLAFRRPGGTTWIRVLYYHHVFDDERAGFRRQLARLANDSDFLSLDDAVEQLRGQAPVRGRFTCVTFDDGFLNHARNAVPALVEWKVPAAFFVPVGYLDGAAAEDFFPNGGHPPVDFLSWGDCRAMRAAGMTIGSHTVRHARLAALTRAEAETELRESKRRLEAELGSPCLHFAAPWGRARDIVPDRDAALAEEAGYHSFLTTRRGVLRDGGSAFAVPRLHAVAHWDA